MISNADFVSRVVNNGRFLTKDEHISRRHVLNIGIQKVTTFVSQKLLDRTLYREDNLFKYVPCIELERVSKIDCPIVELRRCNNLYRTKNKIEGLLYSRYGSSIISVTNVDDSIVFNPSSISTSVNKSKRMFGHLDNTYYIKDGHIYIPDEIESINVTMITLNNKETDELSSCKECDLCKSVWDYEFMCPDKLLEPVVMQVVQEVVSIYKNHQPDENPNLDQNEKNKVSV